MTMKIYAMSDIHGCLAEFEQALSLVNLDGDNKLILLGDYVHSGPDGYGVLDKIIELQRKYGYEKIVVLMGNHEEFVLEGRAPMQENWEEGTYESDDVNDDKYLIFLQNLPLYYVEANTIFVHAGIDEEAGDMWEWSTGDETFLSKYPAEIGKIDGLDMKVVAGHVGTAEISGNPRFHDIFYDGENHYYIDGTVYDSGYIPVIMVDTEEDKYYQVFDGGMYEIEPYEEIIC